MEWVEESEVWGVIPEGDSDLERELVDNDPYLGWRQRGGEVAAVSDCRRLSNLGRRKLGRWLGGDSRMCFVVVFCNR